MGVGIYDRVGRFTFSQVSATRLTVSVVASATNDGEVGRLVDGYFNPQIGRSFRGRRDLMKRVINDRKAIGSQLIKYMRTDVGVLILSADAAAGEARVLMVTRQLIVILDSGPPRRAVRDDPNLRERYSSICLGTSSRGIEIRLLGERTFVKAGPFGEGAGNSEGAGEIHLGDTPNSAVEPGCLSTIGVDVGEEGQRLDGAVSVPRLSEVVRSARRLRVSIQ